MLPLRPHSLISSSHCHHHCHCCSHCHCCCRWRNYGAAHDSWEPAANLSCPQALAVFQRGERTVGEAKKRREREKEAERELERRDLEEERRRQAARVEAIVAQATPQPMLPPPAEQAQAFKRLGADWRLASCLQYFNACQRVTAATSCSPTHRLFLFFSQTLNTQHPPIFYTPLRLF